jgi:hypothetical protein
MIFISYSWADARSSHALHRQLKAGGCDTWIDYERLNLHVDIEEQLENAIRRSQLVLLVDTPKAQASRWTKFEVTCAERARIPIMRIHPRAGERVGVAISTLPDPFCSRYANAPSYSPVCVIESRK